MSFQPSFNTEKLIQMIVIFADEHAKHMIWIPSTTNPSMDK